MNNQQRGFSASFFIHVALLLPIITMNSSMIRISKPVVIDFSVEGPSANDGAARAPMPKNETMKAREPNQPRPQPVAAQQETIRQEAVPRQLTSAGETAAENQAPVPPARPSPVTGSSRAATTISTSEGTSSSPRGEGASGEAMKQSYLKAHFAYIRDLVQQKLSYPTIARKMGWAGKVIISFIVCIDGQATDIMIREGSGIELLDKNAVAAVRDAAPFPKPPVEAQLIIPINYSLN